MEEGKRVTCRANDDSTVSSHYQFPVYSTTGQPLTIFIHNP
jgi:hypothetical protein